MSVLLSLETRLARLQRENERLRDENNSLSEILSGLEYQACLSELGVTDAEMAEAAAMEGSAE